MLNRKNLLPRSGSVLKTRVVVAATLGQYPGRFNRNAVARTGRNPFRVGNTTQLDPELRQPWALGRNRFAVTPTRSSSK